MFQAASGSRFFPKRGKSHKTHNPGGVNEKVVAEFIERQKGNDGTTVPYEKLSDPAKPATETRTLTGVAGEATAGAVPAENQAQS